MLSVSPYHHASRLPVRTRHHAFEPVWSLLQRLAALNGYDSIGAFCNEFGLKRWDATTPSFVDILAGLAALDPEALRFSSPIRIDGKDFQLGHERVRWAGSSAILYKIGRVGVCPSCLAGDRDVGIGRQEFRAYYRAWWSFPSLMNCPLHDVRMIHRSPVDDTLLNPGHYDPRRCGGPRLDLSQIDPVTEDASFERYVVGRLGFVERSVNDLLDRLSIHEVLNLVLRTGYTSVLGTRVSLKKNFTDEETRNWNSRGWEVLGAGESGLIDFLDQFAKRNENTHGLVNHASAFGRFYEWIYQEQRFSPTNYKAVADLIFDYSTRKFAILPTRAVFNRPVEKQSIFPLSKIAAKLRISLRHAGALAKHLGLEGQVTGEGTLLTQADVDAMRSYLDGLIPTADVIEIYGLPRFALRALIEKIGILEPAPALGTNGKRLFFQKGYLDAWWRRIVGDAPLLDRVPEGAILVHRAKNEMQVSAPEVMKLLHDGVLACVGVLQDTPLFEALMVSRSALQEIILPEQEGLCTSEEIKERYGLNRCTLVALTRAGHLKEHQVERQLDGRKTIGMFETAAIDRFFEEFVTADMANVMYREAGTALTVRRNGPDPVIAFAREAGASNFYDREAVERNIRDNEN